MPIEEKKERKKGARIFPFSNVFVCKRIYTFECLHEHVYYVLCTIIRTRLLSPTFILSYIHTYLHTHTHIHVSTSIDIDQRIYLIDKYMHTKIHTYIQSNTFIHSHIHTHIHCNHSLFIDMHTHICRSMHSSAYIHTKSFSYVNTKPILCTEFFDNVGVYKGGHRIKHCYIAINRV